MDQDDLMQVRDSFCTGFYEKALNDCESMPRLGESAEAERQSLYLASKICLGTTTEAELQSFAQTTTEPGVHATILAAQAMTTQGSEQQNAVALLKALPQTPTIKYYLGCCLLATDDIPSALNTLDGGTLEMQALRLQCLLNIDRIDLAELLLLEMNQINEDAAVTKLAQVWFNNAIGNFQEAYLTLGDLESQYSGGANLGISKIILNGKAASCLLMKNFTKALETLKQVPEAKHDAETLSNMLVCQRRLGDHDAADKTFDLIKSKYPNHSLVKNLDTLDTAFEAFNVGTNYHTNPVISNP